MSAIEGATAVQLSSFTTVPSVNIANALAAVTTIHGALSDVAQPDREAVLACVLPMLGVDADRVAAAVRARNGARAGR